MEKHIVWQYSEDRMNNNSATKTCWCYEYKEVCDSRTQLATHLRSDIKLEAKNKQRVEVKAHLVKKTHTHTGSSKVYSVYITPSALLEARSLGCILQIV